MYSFQCLVSGVKAFRDHSLLKMFVNRGTSSVQVNNLILLTNETASGSVMSLCVKLFLEKYRRIVNSRLLFVSVDLGGASCGWVRCCLKVYSSSDVWVWGTGTCCSSFYITGDQHLIMGAYDHQAHFPKFYPGLGDQCRPFQTFTSNICLLSTRAFSALWDLDDYRAI